MMTHEQFAKRIPDYVLGILTNPERQQLEQHTAVCDICRRSLQEEKRLTQLVRQTLTVAAQPSAGRLAAMMPTPPRRRQWAFAWQRQLALVGMVGMLLLGGVGLRLSNQTGSSALAPGIVAATSTQTPTSTNSPTSTLASVPATAVPMSTAVPPSSPLPLLQTPAPIPTPVASILLPSN